MRPNKNYGVFAKIFCYEHINGVFVISGMPHWSEVRHCLTGPLFTVRFRNWMRKRPPSKCCKLLVSAALCFVGMLVKRLLTSAWRVLTEVPASPVIQLRKPPVNKPIVRHSLMNGKIAAEVPYYDGNVDVSNPKCHMWMICYMIVFSIWASLVPRSRTNSSRR